MRVINNRLVVPERKYYPKVKKKTFKAEWNEITSKLRKYDLSNVMLTKREQLS